MEGGKKEWKRVRIKDGRKGEKKGKGRKGQKDEKGGMMEGRAEEWERIKME